jgi:hypothetical protein
MLYKNNDRNYLCKLEDNLYLNIHSLKKETFDIELEEIEYDSEPTHLRTRIEIIEKLKNSEYFMSNTDHIYAKLLENTYHIGTPITIRTNLIDIRCKLNFKDLHDNQIEKLVLYCEKNDILRQHLYFNKNKIKYKNIVIDINEIQSMYFVTSLYLIFKNGTESKHNFDITENEAKTILDYYFNYSEKTDEI